MALKWLVGYGTQGSADAFVESEIITGLSNATRTAYRVRRIEWILPALPGVDSNIEAVLSRRSKSAIAYNTPNIIDCVKRSVEFTTSGLGVQENMVVYRYDRDEELLIVEESIFLDIDSNGTSASNVLIVRIGYETRSITENERLAITSTSA